MTQTSDIEAFGAGLSGTALVRGDHGYDAARSVWNGKVDRYPAVIARCRSAADVGAAIEFAEVVTADGRRLRAAADENSDLFWALRGGGGNFGVVTEFEFRLHPVGPMVHVSLFFWGLDQGTEALRLGRNVFATLPADANAMIISGNAPPAPFVPQQHHFSPCYGLAVVGFGSADEHAHLLAPIREALPPLFEFVTPMPYTQLQQMFDEEARWGVNCYEKALYLDALSDEAIGVITEHQVRKASPQSMLHLFRLDGAYAQVGEAETAFGGSRSSRISANIVALTDDVELLAPERAWVRSFWDALRPHATGAGGYINTMADIEEDRVRASYGRRPNTSGWLGSRPRTTRTTSFTATPTSNPRGSRSSECRVLVARRLVLALRQVVVV